MNYTTADYRAFARELVSTGELDPIYTMLYRARAEKGDDWVAKFCMYMLMFYETSGAYSAADDSDFWEYVRTNYPTAVRGKERRYFRGEAGIASYTSLARVGGAIEAFQVPVQATTLPAFRRAVESAGVVGFGEYFMLKWADYCANIFLSPLSFDDLPKMLPSPPLKCLKQVFPDKTPRQGLEIITSWVSDMDDPFSGTRKCGFSEAETIACAIPSYLHKGRYKMGDDIRKYREQLKEHPDLVRLLP